MYPNMEISMKNIRNKSAVDVGLLVPIAPKASMFSNLVEVVSSIFENIHIVTTNVNKEDYGKAYVNSIEYEYTNIYNMITNHIQLQLKMSYKLFQLRKNVDVWIFFLGAEVLLLPMITAKLFNKKVIILLGGNSLKEIEMNYSKLLIFVRPILKTTLTLSNRIVVYSENLVKEWHLCKYEYKILIAHEHFVNFNKFKIEKKFGERDVFIGYIGRLSAEKGTLNFINAIPEILIKRSDLKFIVGGDGQLCSKIMRFVDTNNLNEKVKFAGWIPQDNILNYLNELKLLIMPSYSEGLPNVMLESMACGTPVLATSVGAIPDVIKDGETGFIMEDNSPACIAKNVVRALEHPDLEMIVENARALVEREFTYDVTVERWKEILERS